MKKAIVMGIVAGILGVGLALAVVHVYVDHKNWHQVVNAIAAQQAAAAARAKPPVLPTPDPVK